MTVDYLYINNMKRSEIYLKVYENFNPNWGICTNIEEYVNLEVNFKNFPELASFPESEIIKDSAIGWLFNKSYYQTRTLKHADIRKNVLLFAYAMAKSKRQ